MMLLVFGVPSRRFLKQEHQSNQDDQEIWMTEKSNAIVLNKIDLECIFLGFESSNGTPPGSHLRGGRPSLNESTFPEPLFSSFYLECICNKGIIYLRNRF